MNIASKLIEKVLPSKQEEEVLLPTSTPVRPLLDPHRTMKAIVWHGKHDVRYEDVPRPLITAPTDILLRITGTTICGSDLHLYNGMFPDVKPGDIIGHEFMGIIEEIGDQVKKLSVGQRVVVAFDIACGFCEYCKRQEYTCCDTTNPSKKLEELYGHRTAGFYGYSHLTGGVPGGQAEYVRVAFADNNCLVIPEDLSDEQVLYLSDVVPTAYHGTEMAKVEEGKTVGIWGLGPVGLMAARWSQIRGAKRIIGIDCVPDRLSRAQRLGIDTINFKEQDVKETIFKMEPRGLDCGIECSGFEYAKSALHKVELTVGLETDSADILNEMIYCVRKCGNIGIIGVYVGKTNHFEIGPMMEKALVVTGGQSPTQKYWQMALKKIQSGELDPTFIISHKGTLAAAPELYEKFSNREALKVFMRPGLPKVQPVVAGTQ